MWLDARWVIGLLLALSAAGCCQMTGNFGGGPCTGSAHYPEPKPDPGPFFRYRIQFACSEPLEVVRSGGEKARDGDAFALATVATPNTDYTREPGAPDECDNLAREPNLSLWIRTKDGPFRSFVVPLEEKRRKVLVVSCADGIPHVDVSQQRSPRTPCF
jgi:hypothetical protein